MKKLSAILILLFFCAINIVAQVLQGKVFIEKTEEPLKNISIEISEYNGLTKIYKTDSLGCFIINSDFLKLNTKYRIQSNFPNLLSVVKIITTGNYTNDTTFTNLEFKSIMQEPHFLPIHFEYNSYDLTPESMVGLDNLTHVLINNPNICINILTTCEKGELNFNKEICKKRGEIIRNYIVNNGISKKRLDLKSMKNNSPFIVDNATSEIYNLQKGTILNDIFLDTLKDENIKIKLRYFNRRSEFKIIHSK